MPKIIPQHVLRNICYKSANDYDNESWQSATAMIFSDDGKTYKELLDQWQLYEIKNQNNVNSQKAYEKLYNELRSNNDKVTQAKRDLMKIKFNSWQKYYEQRIQNFLLGEQSTPENFAW